ncbi:UNVERIFIED_CONTAM: putative UDP-glucuronate:xylan alpha-glucuronosyltransferase 4 [Sesamum angustifolium]|uniref:UDP-glucuronate:xylan alpha-glucuronosyltransferase 4 n=1 Tax=Sesamum angustifolium TaxID=2727405 RepID=A0AAW2MQB0_9LAMI
MASKPSKPKPLTFPFILFLIALLIFTILYLKQLHNEFHTHPKSARNPKWFEIVAREMGDENINIGFVNMDGTTITDEVHTRGKMVKVRFNPVDEGIEWSDLFPEWIDENSTSNCPELPMPKFEDYGKLDVVVARVPCTGDSGSCGPVWEIFRCDDLLWHGGNSWIYKPELRRVKQKVFMPVGSCQLAPPFAQSGEELWRRHSETSNKGMPREAYVTVLHSSEAYVCGAIALAQSIIQSNSTKDLVLLADNHISEKSIQGLRSAGWKIKRIKRIRSPYSEKDSDLIVTRNLDDFFIYPQLSAVGNDKHIFNSGLMLVEPSICTFKTLMKKRLVVGSYNGGDQGFLNEVFPWWQPPAKLNQLKFFGFDHDYKHEIPHDIDSANERWVFTCLRMLRHFCSLTPAMDARIQKYRSRARMLVFLMGTGKIKVKDPRRNSM